MSCTITPAESKSARGAAISFLQVSRPTTNSRDLQITLIDMRSLVLSLAEMVRTRFLEVDKPLRCCDECLALQHGAPAGVLPRNTVLPMPDPSTDQRGAKRKAALRRSV